MELDATTLMCGTSSPSSTKRMLLRTAFSRIVTEAWDFSCALFDTKGGWWRKVGTGCRHFPVAWRRRCTIL
jgi:hypothetical protein